MLLPEPVHDHARGEWVRRVQQPVGQIQPVRLLVVARLQRMQHLEPARGRAFQRAALEAEQRLGLRACEDAVGRDVPVPDHVARDIEDDQEADPGNPVVAVEDAGERSAVGRQVVAADDRQRGAVLPDHAAVVGREVARAGRTRRRRSRRREELRARRRRRPGQGPAARPPRSRPRAARPVFHQRA